MKGKGKSHTKETPPAEENIKEKVHSFENRYSPREARGIRVKRFSNICNELACPRCKSFAVEKGKEFLLISALFCLILFSYFLYLYVFSPPKISTSYSQETLTPLMPLQLSEGENYSYAKSGGQNFTYSLKAGYGCLETYLSVGNYSVFSGCVDRFGKEKSNSAKTSEGMPFEEWMLSAREGWSWGRNVSVLLEPPGIMSITQYSYKTLGREKKFGRDTYLVQISVLPENRTYFEWVDEGKRIMVALEGEKEGKVRLISAMPE